MMYAATAVAEIKSKVAQSVERIRKESERSPKLVALLIGDDPVSRTYVDLKRKDCAEVGITSEVIDLSSYSKEEMPSKVVETLTTLNADSSVNAIIPQMPFDGKVGEELVFSTLSPDKDVDGLTPYSLGKLVRREYTLEGSLLPCTPKGVVLLARHYGVPIAGSDVAIVGRSVLVGEPVRKLFQDLNATSTCYHTGSKRLIERLREADIVVAASGRPPELFGSSGFRLSGKMVKEGCSVFSVGVRRDPKAEKMLFDIEISTLKGKCAFLTPNTGGVGAMTRACLLQNTVIATEIQMRKNAD
ncbi:MAG TPA: bifunctional 5,10-methylenetetrahydrofolate dehydrogenase/5,10-methenyltetrahydrofolate cyclohydrolase [Nitrososphaerales archaeon]|nr:bifunctional 5,10-methylenetetrahydrofolate dehydrogenase/5,10-methenyltetrahydrofolate cyclohydrolase [Nitrososphaerales archaeon]